MKKFCLIVAVLVLLVTIPFYASAEDDMCIAQGTCGDSLDWVLENNGTLTITGIGSMCDYTWSSVSGGTAPWYIWRDNIKKVVVESGVTTVGNSAFYECDEITNVELPSSIVAVKSYAFYGCFGITSFELPSMLTTIGSNAFCLCTNLEKIEIPNTVSELGGSAFASCRNLKEVIISSGLSQIWNSTFARCISLMSITIPTGVESIGKYAFEGCTNLATVSMSENVKSIGYDAFSGTKWLASQGDFPIVNGILLKYQGSKSNVEIPNGVTVIAEEAFAGNKNIKSLTIPNDVSDIKYGAFYNCTNLETLSIGRGVKNIELDAFGNLYGLKVIYYYAESADTSEKLGLNSFFDYVGRDVQGTVIYVLDSVKRIPEYLFLGQSGNVKAVYFEGNPPELEHAALPSKIIAHYPYNNLNWTNDIFDGYKGQYFNFIWKPFSESDVLEATCSIKDYCYIVGDELKESDITLSIKYVDGCEVEYNYASGLLQLEECDMSSEGLKTLKVSYNDIFAILNIYVHSTRDVELDKTVYAANVYSGLDDMRKSVEYIARGAYSLTLFFSEKALENDYHVQISYDFVNSEGSKVGVGFELKDTTVLIPSDNVTISYAYDEREEVDAIPIDKIVATYAHDYTVETIPSTCTKEGCVKYHCALCNQTIEDPIQKKNHTWDSGVMKNDPTCTENGIKVYTCTLCEETKEEIYWAYGHCYDPITHKCGFCNEIDPSFAGWQKIDGCWYYYSHGAILTGWQKIDGYWFYFDKTTAIMKTGWQKIDGYWYYFKGGDSGRMLTGWQKIGGYWYYFKGGDSGRMLTGWQKIGGYWYYFKGGDSGRMLTGWQKIDGYWYYFKGGDSGKMLTGWQKIGGDWYYFLPGDNGRMVTGWQTISGKKYYFFPGDNGRMAIGTVSIDGKKYRFDSNGVLVK